MAGPTSHSRIGASSTKRWMTCPGSPALSDGIESKSSEFAAEGTLAHDLADNLLNGRPANFPAGDMNMAVMVYVNYVKSLGGELGTEQRFHLNELHESLFGTSDAVVWQPDTKTLHVIDYKHGAGVPVEIEGNTQTRYYAVGALLASGHPAEKIVMTIVQPRCAHPDGPIRSETIDAMSLLDWCADLVDSVLQVEEADQAFKTMSPAVFADTYLHEGEHCRWCPASPKCPKLEAKSQQLAKVVFAPAVPYESEKLAEALHWLPILEGWIKSVREFAYSEVEQGKTVPGWKLVEKRATRKWADEDGAENFIRGLAKVGVVSEAECFTTKIITVAQLEKLIGKDDIPSELVSKESSGLTLVAESDKRSAAKTKASEVFDAVPQTTFGLGPK
jgi:hypothetical protein